MYVMPKIQYCKPHSESQLPQVHQVPQTTDPRPIQSVYAGHDQSNNINLTTKTYVLLEICHDGLSTIADVGSKSVDCLPTSVGSLL